MTGPNDIAPLRKAATVPRSTYRTGAAQDSGQPIVSIGYAAAAAWTGATRGRVLGVFTRGFYLQTDAAGLVFVASSDAGRGPLNAIAVGVQRFPVEAGALFAMGGAHACCTGSRCALDASSANLWDPRKHPQRLPAARRDAVFAKLLAVLSAREDAEGLARIWSRASPSCDPWVLHAREGMLGTLDWIARATHDEGSHAPAPRAVLGLIGLGPGLTPSGDDFLSGVLLALAWTGQVRLRDRLAGSIQTRAAYHTNVISAAHLRCAAQGATSETMRNLLSALATRRESRIASALKTLLATGSYSPWDTLSGIVVGLGGSVSPLIREQARARLDHP